MQLENIDKARYSKHFKLVFVAVVAALLVISISTSSLMIQLFTDGEGSHFWLNLAGVVIAALITGSFLRKFRQHPFMYEVMYVWDLKQQLNAVNRKQKQLKEAAEQGDAVAMQALNFCYQGSRQLFLLDDNTLTMEELERWMDELQTLADDHQVDLDLEQYEPSVLSNY